jgi:hypothetical protein
MDVNMVTPADPVQPKAQFLHQALKIAKSDIGSAALDGLKRLFWAPMAASSLNSTRLRLRDEGGRQPMKFGSNS